jgi:hypothetical protein
LNRSERKNVLLLPGKRGAAETGGLMYLRRVSGGRSRDEAVETSLLLGFGLEFGRLVLAALKQPFAPVLFSCGRSFAGIVDGAAN